MDNLKSVFEVLSDELRPSGHSLHLHEERDVVLVRTRHGEKVVSVTGQEAAPLLPLDLVALVKARLDEEPGA